MILRKKCGLVYILNGLFLDNTNRWQNLFRSLDHPKFSGFGPNNFGHLCLVHLQGGIDFLVPVKWMQIFSGSHVRLQHSDWVSPSITITGLLMTRQTPSRNIKASTMDFIMYATTENIKLNEHMRCWY